MLFEEQYRKNYTEWLEMEANEIRKLHKDGKPLYIFDPDDEVYGTRKGHKAAEVLVKHLNRKKKSMGDIKKWEKFVIIMKWKKFVANMAPTREQTQEQTEEEGWKEQEQLRKDQEKLREEMGLNKPTLDLIQFVAIVLAFVDFVSDALVRCIPL